MSTEKEDKDVIDWRCPPPQDVRNWIMTDRYKKKKKANEESGAISRWEGTTEDFNSPKRGKVSQKLPKVKMPRQHDEHTDRKAFGGDQIYVKSIRSKGSSKQPSESVSMKKKFRTPRGDSDVSTDRERKYSNSDRMSSEFIIDKIKKFEAKTKLAIQ